MQKRGYEVEVWDCSLWYCPEYALNYNPTDCFVFSGLKSFKTFEATKSAFSKVVQKDIVIDVFQLLEAWNVEKTRCLIFQFFLKE